MIIDGFGTEYNDIVIDNDVLQDARGHHTLWAKLGDLNNNGLKDFIGGFIEFNLYIMLYIALIVTMVGVALIGGCIMNGFIALNSNTKKESEEVDLEQQTQPMKTLYKPTAPPGHNCSSNDNIWIRQQPPQRQ